jgi:hypothetical protein
MNDRLQVIIKDYASILNSDGNVDDEELKQWVLLDEEIENKSDLNIKKIISEIRKHTKYLDRKEMTDRRMALYDQGLTDNEIAKIQGVTPMAIYFWRKNKKLKSNFMKKGGCSQLPHPIEGGACKSSS